MTIFLTDELDVRNEVLYTFRNMCHLGNPRDVFDIIMKCHFLEGLADLLQLQEEVSTLKAALGCLWEMLYLGSKLGGENNIVLNILRPIPGFLDRLETLQYHTDESIYQELSKILKQFLTIENETM